MLDASRNEISEDYTDEYGFVHVGHRNPFRYRGYFYDVNSGLYYLQSRYYDPETGRFLNADTVEYLDPESINGLNLYAYCGNNPVMYSDPSGHFGIMALLAITLTALVIGGVGQLASNAAAGMTGSELWRGVAGAAVGTAVNAIMLCLTVATGGVSLIISAVISAVVQTSIDTLETALRGEIIDWNQTVKDWGVNFITTASGNILGAMLVPTNAGWFQPKHFFSIFTKAYGQKIIMQTLAGSGLASLINLIKKWSWSSYQATPINSLSE